MKPATRLAVLVFLLVALCHLVRMVLGTEILVAGKVLPMWVSLLGIVIPAVLAIALWREAQPSSAPGHSA